MKHDRQMYLDSESSGRELLSVAFIQTVFSHQRGEMLQTVSVAVSGRDVQQIISLLVSDPLQILCCKVRLRRHTSHLFHFIALTSNAHLSVT